MRDDFNGSDLDASWSVVRRDQTLAVTGGALNLVAQAGDVYQTANDAKNLVLRTAPSGPWSITTKLNFKGLVQYQQAGILVYGDDDNYTKFDRVATNTATGTNTEKFEFINEVAGTPRNGSADASANLACDVPGRLLHACDVRRDQHHRRVLDRRHDLDRGRPDGGAAGQRQDRPVRPVQRGGHQRRPPSSTT